MLRVVQSVAFGGLSREELQSTAQRCYTLHGCMINLLGTNAIGAAVTSGVLCSKCALLACHRANKPITIRTAGRSLWRLQVVCES